MNRAQLLQTFFFSRRDTVAALKTWTDRQTKLRKSHPQPIDTTQPGALENLLAYHVGGPASTSFPPPIKYTTRAKPREHRAAAVVVREADEHLRIGSFLVAEDGTTVLLCIDFDGGGASAGHSASTTLTNPTAAVVAAWYRAEDMGLTAYLEKSGGGAGWHLWIFFSTPIAAADARKIGLAIVAGLDAELQNGERADARSNRGLEVFPKQDRIKAGGYGNMVWLPFWHHAAKPDGNTFFHVVGAELAPYEPEEFNFCDTSPDEVARLLALAPAETDAPADLFDHYDATDADGERALISSALAALDPDMGYHDWLAVGMAIHSFDIGSAGLELWSAWSARGAKCKPGETAEKWAGFSSAGSVHLGSLFAMAKRAGWSAPTNAPQMSDDELAAFLDVQPADLEIIERVEGAAQFREQVGGFLADLGHEPATLTAARPLGPHAVELPVIQLNARNLRDMIADAWAAYFLLSCRIPEAAHLYQRNGELVRLVTNPDNGAPFVKAVGEAELFNLMGTWATWAKITDTAIINGFPPVSVAKAMLAIPHPDLLRVEEIVTVPFFDENLDLVAAPGHHAASRVFLHGDDGALPEILEVPTADDVAAAVSLLVDDLFIDFPFVSQADRCHAVATFLLPFVRRAIDGPTPIHLLEAPAPGSGKSLLADLVQLVFSGIASATTTGRDEEETRKKITSLLERGERIIVIDNVRAGIDSAQIASALTSTVWTDRALGSNRMIAAPNRAVWIFTGNNPDLSLELARRSIRIRIDAETDRPFERVGFKHDPIREWATENRRALISAALTLVQNWKACGCVPETKKRLGSFEAWSALVGGILAAGGVPGFLENQSDLYDTSDSKTADWKAFVELWGEKLGAATYSSVDLVDFAVENDMLAELLGDDSRRVQSIRMGKQLRRVRDTTIRKWKIVSRRDHHAKAQLWKLEPVHLQILPPLAGSAGSGGKVETALPADQLLENKAFADSAGSDSLILTHEKKTDALLNAIDEPRGALPATPRTIRSQKFDENSADQQMKIDLAKLD